MATDSQPPGTDDAAELIRAKVARVYADAPDVRQELEEAAETPQRSKHQRFMHELSTSGKDLATIQTEWHNYYQALTATEKHQVWQEFYASQSALTGQPPAGTTESDAQSDAQTMSAHKQQAARPKRAQRQATTAKPRKLRDARSPRDVQTAIRDSVTAGGKLQAKHHLQSLLFGLSMGLIAVVIFLFGFFNEVFIAPFIQPSRVSASTPLIVSPSDVAPTPNPEVIIPKINVQIPVNYTETSTDENVIENDLEDGVVHYPTTVEPGQQGNTAFFGHSSNNIFNSGHYKFAFVLLHTLVNGDTFYLTYNNKVYVYKVISHTIVSPDDVGVLGPVAGQTATATLITCDPPGTSINRLVVVGQQISPDPTANTTAAPMVTPSSAGTTLPGNGPTVLGHFVQTGEGKVVIVVVSLGVGWLVLRRIHRRFNPRFA